MVTELLGLRLQKLFLNVRLIPHTSSLLSDQWWATISFMYYLTPKKQLKWWLFFETTGLNAVCLSGILRCAQTITFVLFLTVIHLKTQELFLLQVVSPMPCITDSRNCTSLE